MAGLHYDSAPVSNSDSKAKVDQSSLTRQGLLSGEFETNYIHILNRSARRKF